jgi:hypothetical protein
LPMQQILLYFAPPFHSLTCFPMDDRDDGLGVPGAGVGNRLS